MQIRSQVLSSLHWSAGARFGAQLFTWAITLVVIRLLLPSDYGLLAMATLFIAFLALMSELGLGAALVQSREIDDFRLRQAFSVILAVNFAIMLLLLMAAPLFATFFHEPRLTSVVRALSIQFPVMAFAAIPQSLVEREMDFKRLSLADLFSSIGGSLLTLLLAFTGYGVWALVWGSLATMLGRTIGLNIIQPFLKRPVLSMAGTRHLLLFGGNVTLSRILWFFYSQADILIAGRLLGKDFLGTYSVAMHLATLPVQKISGIINQVAFPAFAKIQGDREKVAAHLLLAIRSISFVGFPVLWGISCVAPELVLLLLGEKWQAAVFPMRVLGIIMPLRMISNIMPSAYQGIGRADIGVKNLISASIIMPTAFVIGSQWGVEGLSIAWLIGFPIVFAGNLWRALPILGLRMDDIGRAISRPALCAGGMFAVVSLLRLAMSSILPLFMLLAILIACGAGAYATLAFILNRAGWREFRGLLGR